MCDIHHQTEVLWAGWQRLEGNKRAGNWGEAVPDLCISEASCRLGPHIIRGLCEAASLKEKEKKLKTHVMKIMIQKKLVKRYVI